MDSMNQSLSQLLQGQEISYAQLHEMDCNLHYVHYSLATLLIDHGQRPFTEACTTLSNARQLTANLDLDVHAHHDHILRDIRQCADTFALHGCAYATSRASTCPLLEFTGTELPYTLIENGLTRYPFEYHIKFFERYCKLSAPDAFVAFNTLPNSIVWQQAAQQYCTLVDCFPNRLVYEQPQRNQLIASGMQLIGFALALQQSPQTCVNVLTQYGAHFTSLKNLFITAWDDLMSSNRDGASKSLAQQHIERWEDRIKYMEDFQSDMGGYANFGKLPPGRAGAAYSVSEIIIRNAVRWRCHAEECLNKMREFKLRSKDALRTLRHQPWGGLVRLYPAVAHHTVEGSGCLPFLLPESAAPPAEFIQAELLGLAVISYSYTFDHLSSHLSFNFSGKIHTGRNNFEFFSYSTPAMIKKNPHNNKNLSFSKMHANHPYVPMTFEPFTDFKTGYMAARWRGNDRSEKDFKKNMYEKARELYFDHARVLFSAFCWEHAKVTVDAIPRVDNTALTATGPYCTLLEEVKSTMQHHISTFKDRLIVGAPSQPFNQFLQTKKKMSACATVVEGLTAIGYPRSYTTIFGTQTLPQVVKVIESNNYGVYLNNGNVVAAGDAHLLQTRPHLRMRVSAAANDGQTPKLRTNTQVNLFHKEVLIKWRVQNLHQAEFVVGLNWGRQMKYTTFPKQEAVRTLIKSHDWVYTRYEFHGDDNPICHVTVCKNNYDCEGGTPLCPPRQFPRPAHVRGHHQHLVFFGFGPNLSGANAQHMDIAQVLIRDRVEATCVMRLFTSSGFDTIIRMYPLTQLLNLLNDGNMNHHEFRSRLIRQVFRPFADENAEHDPHVLALLGRLDGGGWPAAQP